MEDSMKVTFWGTRGSCPAPFPDRMEYGGNTSCVSVQFEGGLAVFDCGTGIVPLGKGLDLEDMPIHIFMGHLHLDHIEGLMLLPQIFKKGAKIHIYGASFEPGVTFRERLSGFWAPPFWPVALEHVPASVTWHEIRPGETVALSENARVRTMEAAHPNGGMLFRMEQGSQSVVYGLDMELGNEERTWERYREFSSGCGLLIFDSPYTKEDYGKFCGYGHSYYEQGIRMAKECRAGELMISHHDWGRTDEELGRLEKELSGCATDAGVNMRFAREGTCIAL